jgi:hypothetical protein
MVKSKKDPRSPKPNRSNLVKRLKVIKANHDLINKLKELLQ